MPPRKSGGIGKTTGEMNGIPVLLTVDVSRCNLLQHNALRGCTTCMSEAQSRDPATLFQISHATLSSLVLTAAPPP